MIVRKNYTTHHNANCTNDRGLKQESMVAGLISEPTKNYSKVVNRSSCAEENLMYIPRSHVFRIIYILFFIELVFLLVAKKKRLRYQTLIIVSRDSRKIYLSPNLFDISCLEVKDQHLTIHESF